METAIDAAADRADVERGDGERIADVESGDGPAAIVDGTAVLPEPMLVAKSGQPAPLVTASPPLAAEPSAMDVVRADNRAPGEEPSFDGGDMLGAVPAVAGQPMLAIEPTAPTAATQIGENDLEAVLGVSDPTTGGTYAIGGSHPSIMTRRVTVVEVVGPRQGFRRGGFAFGPQARRFLRSQLTDDQFQAIRDEPTLAVAISDVDVDAALLDAALMHDD